MHFFYIHGLDEAQDMIFTYSVELFSGEHIRHLLLLETKKRSASVLDLADSNTALTETDSTFLELTW